MVDWVQISWWKNWDKVSQTLFSLYLHNQWTNFHKPSCTGKLQIRAIHTYVGCTKATPNNQYIRPSVTAKVSLAIISWTTRQICTIELVLESIYQTVSNDISYIIWRLVFIEIQVYQCNDIISYLLKLTWQHHQVQFLIM